MKTKLYLADAEHEVAYQDLCALVNKHADKVTPVQLLAIASNMVGKLVAMQDQREFTAAQAMTIVAQNIEYGNQQVLSNLGKIGGPRN